MDTVIYITKKEEREFVDWIFDRMYEKPVHCGIEFANFTLNFDGSEDANDQTDLMSSIMEYMKFHTIIPCLVTMVDIATRISAIECAQYKEEDIPEEDIQQDLHIPFPEDKGTDNIIDDWKKVAPVLIDKPIHIPDGTHFPIPEDTVQAESDNSTEPIQEPDDTSDDTGPTFRDLFNYFEDHLYSTANDNHIHALGKFNTMMVPSSNNDNRRYAFSNRETDQVHYMVFENNPITGLKEIILSNNTSNWTIDPDYLISDLIEETKIPGTVELLNMFNELLE